MPNEEIFDVVNQSDQVIGRMPRSVVHRRKLYHRSVHGLVFDASRRVFLQLRAPHKDCNPGLWDSSVAGHVEAGETYDRAIIRETAEELGIRLRAIPHRMFKLNASIATGYEFCWVYRIRDGGPLLIDRNEAVDGKWLTVEELNRWVAEQPEVLTGSIKSIWSRYLSEYEA